MADISSIQPEAAALSPQGPPTAPEAAPAPSGPDINALPPEVASLPVVQAVSIGQPAAVSATEADKDNPALALIAGSAQDLPAAGLGLFADEKNAILFNPEMISPQEIAEAVKNGTLESVAIPIGTLEQAFTDVQAEGGGGAPPVGAGPSAPASSATTSKINSARLKNLKPQAPTGGAKAGQGIVNDLTRPVI